MGEVIPFKRPEKQEPKTDSNVDFNEIETLNAINKARLEADRKAQNEAVKKSYKLRKKKREQD